MNRLDIPYQSYQRQLAAQRALEKDKREKTTKVCARRTWALAQELHLPVEKKSFEFHVSANQSRCVFDVQSQLFIDVENDNLYVWRDSPDLMLDGYVQDGRELDRDPEQWDYVEDYIDLFEDE